MLWISLKHYKEEIVLAQGNNLFSIQRIVTGVLVYTFPHLLCQFLSRINLDNWFLTQFYLVYSYHHEISYGYRKPQIDRQLKVGLLHDKKNKPYSLQEKRIGKTAL